MEKQERNHQLQQEETLAIGVTNTKVNVVFEITVGVDNRCFSLNVTYICTFVNINSTRSFRATLQFREEIQQNLHEISRLHIIVNDGESQSKTTNAYIEEVAVFPSPAPTGGETDKIKCN